MSGSALETISGYRRCIQNRTKCGKTEKILADEKSYIIDESFKKYKFGARMLEVIIRKRYKLSIAHNKIYQHLMVVVTPNLRQPNKRQRKWIRYERKLSMYAIHIDWHEAQSTEVNICAVLDDSSRKILAADEFGNIDTENSIVINERVLFDPRLCLNSLPHSPFSSLR